MSIRDINPWPFRLTHDTLSYGQHLDNQLKKRWNMSIGQFNVLKVVFDVLTLVLAGYAIYAGADPLLALVAAAVILQGPNVIAWYLVYQDVLEKEDALEMMDETSDDNNSSDE